MRLSNGSLRDYLCGNCLSLTCPTWLPFAAQMHRRPVFHRSHALHRIARVTTKTQKCFDCTKKNSKKQAE